MPNSFQEYPLSTPNSSFRLGKVSFGTYNGAFVTRNKVGTIAFLAEEPVVRLVTPLTGDTITAASSISEELIYATPAGTLAALTFALPDPTNCRVGQTRRLMFSQIVTALTITVNGGGTLAGAALTAAAVNTRYEWQCISVAGVATWLRIN